MKDKNNDIAKQGIKLCTLMQKIKVGENISALGLEYLLETTYLLKNIKNKYVKSGESSLLIKLEGLRKMLTILKTEDDLTNSQRIILEVWKNILSQIAFFRKSMKEDFETVMSIRTDKKILLLISKADLIDEFINIVTDYILDNYDLIYSKETNLIPMNGDKLIKAEEIKEKIFAIQIKSNH